MQTQGVQEFKVVFGLTGVNMKNSSKNRAFFRTIEVSGGIFWKNAQ